VLKDVMDLIARGCFPGGTKKNWLYYKQWLDFAPDITMDEQTLVCDAQTSGGMLICVPAAKADALVASLKKHKALAASVIGELVADHPGRVAVTR
jgi:selenide,water dikinase